MLAIEEMTEVEVRDVCFKAIKREVGPVGLARFLNQYLRGRGDYTKERGEWLGDITVNDVMAGVASRQADQKP